MKPKMKALLEARDRIERAEKITDKHADAVGLWVTLQGRHPSHGSEFPRVYDSFDLLGVSRSPAGPRIKKGNGLYSPQNVTPQGHDLENHRRVAAAADRWFYTFRARYFGNV